LEQILAHFLVEINAMPEKIGSNQEEMKNNQATLEARMYPNHAKIDAWQIEMMTCQKVTEAYPEGVEANP
jgi:hypothetical protein